MDKKEVLKIVLTGALLVLSYNLGINSTEPVCSVEGKSKICINKWHRCKGMLNKPLICTRRDND